MGLREGEVDEEMGPASMSSSRPPEAAGQAVGRMQAAAKKDAAFDLAHHQALPGMLEFFDLRELQDTIMSKALWPLFEPRFANKQTLATKFDQLAELRNGVRHSRAVGDIMRKEGEAGGVVV